MGKQGKYGASQQGWYDGWQRQQGRSWSAWPGAKRSNDRKKYTQFPGYEDDWTQEQPHHISVVDESRYEGPGAQQTMTLTQAVQQAVNTVRKADGRLQRLQKEHRLKTSKWAAYKAAMKAAFNKEQHRHENDIRRIDNEITQALEAQQEAHHLVETAVTTFKDRQQVIWRSRRTRRGSVKTVDAALLHKGLHTCMPCVTAPPPWHSWSAPDSPGLPSWADDFTFLQVADTPSDLCHKVTGATQLIVSHASSFGMELTFAVDKTACLLTSNCPRIIPGHTVADKEGRSCLQVVDEVADQAHLMPLVDSYPHLGCIAVANANPQPEIRYRYAQALSVLNPLRRQPFAASDIPLPLRRTFMRSLVVSRFAYASATTVLSAATGACGIACMSSCGGASFAGLIWRRSFTASGYYRSLRRLLPC